MMQPDYQRLEHILDYCDDISSLIKRFGSSYDSFISDTAYQKAAAFCILQIGELANGLSDEFRAGTSGEIPWRSIRGMRNVVVHNYGSISTDMLWNTMTNDIPLLRKFCESRVDTVCSLNS